VGRLPRLPHQTAHASRRRRVVEAGVFVAVWVAAGYLLSARSAVRSAALPVAVGVSGAGRSARPDPVVGPFAAMSGRDTIGEEERQGRGAGTYRTPRRVATTATVIAPEPPKG
jgi:hypothetical protein